MDAAIKSKIDTWLSGNFDDATKQEIRKLQGENNETELTEAFYKNLEFGTGGLRGLMGVGTNRMNKYTVGMATQGFSNYLKKTYGDAEVKVVIGHDSRNNSRFFAETTANVFAANGSKFFCLKRFVQLRN
jgi:phosphoglucomutase